MDSVILEEDFDENYEPSEQGMAALPCLIYFSALNVLLQLWLRAQ